MSNINGAVLREIIGARLKEERERLGYSQLEFAAIGGASKRSQIDWEKGKLVPNAEFLATIAAAGVDVLYILTGEQALSALSGDEKELISGYRGLDIRGKAGVLGMIDGLGTDPSDAARSKQAQLANTIAGIGQITGENAQVIHGTNHGTISTGKIINKVVRKKKDAPER